MPGRSTPKILVLGSGGREHALCWHLKRSGFSVECAPGNDAIARLVPSWNFKDFAELQSKAKERGVEEIIVGPEKYLAEGVTNFFEGSSSSINIFGPSKEAARLETDKAWAKEFCIRNKIPTARARVVKSATELENALAEFQPPFVVKAAGLAAGKGVWIGDDRKEAISFGASMLKEHSSLVIEEFIEGEEISYFILLDNEKTLFIGAAQDHKRLLENDRGPNTGGMGAYSPVPLLTPELQTKIQHEVVDRLVAALKRESISYRGFVFFGLMITRDERVFVLEFNCRLGDPETQALLLKLKTPLPELIANLRASSTPTRAEYHDGVALNVIVSALGYPEAPRSGTILDGIDSPPTNCEIFHSGTNWDSARKQWIASGGRLFSVATLGASLAECQERIYPWLENVSFKKEVHFRKDIGAHAFKYLKQGRSHA